MSKIKNIGIIGSGNLAWHLVKRLESIGRYDVELFGRNPITSKLIALQFNVELVPSIKDFSTHIDLFILAVNDHAIKKVSPLLKKTEALIIHCSGTQTIDILSKEHLNCGILWPLQTFSKQRDPDWEYLPLILEANNQNSKELLYNFSRSLSRQVQFKTQEERRKLHLAAVYACNFSNHMYLKAANVLEGDADQFNLLKPLILETASKVMDLDPELAQTGPAVRNDSTTMAEHKTLLEDSEKEFYDYLSNDIKKTHQKKNDEL